MGLLDRMLGKSSEPGTQIEEIDDMIASSYADKNPPVEEAPTFEVNPEPVSTMTEAPVSAKIDWVDQGTPSDTIEPVSWDIPDFEKSSSKQEPVIDVMGDAKLKKPFTSEVWEKGEETPSEQWSKREEKKEEEQKQEEQKQEEQKKEDQKKEEQKKEEQKKEEQKKEEQKKEEQKKEEQKKEEQKKEEQKNETKEEKEKREKKEAEEQKSKDKWKKKWEGAKANVFGTPKDDMDYARLGGYDKGTKEELNAEIKSLSDSNDKLEKQIDDLNSKISIEIGKRDELKAAYDDETDKEKEKELYAKYIRQKNYVTTLENEREALDRKLSKNKSRMDENRRAISTFDRLVKEQKEKASNWKKAGKKLSKIGEATKDVLPAGMYDARLSKVDWFGPKGFLSKPFADKNIQRSAVETVQVKTRNLDNVTRSTGGSVGRSMIDVIPVKPNKNIAPLGAPGTIYGARQQFDYSIPAKKISLLEVSGLSKGGNVNPDILPSVYSPLKQQQSVTQYKQVIQPDGTVVNVPVPVQQRKSKIYAVSVNRYTKGVQINGMKVGATRKSASKDRLTRGIESVGYMHNIKFTGMKAGKSPKMDKLVRGVESVGSFNKLSKVVPDAKVTRKQFDVGLINVKNIDLNILGSTKNNVVKTIEPVKEDRKSKKTMPLAKLGFTLTGVKLNQNLKKLVLKHKTK
jgi:actin-related protein